MFPPVHPEPCGHDRSTDDACKADGPPDPADPHSEGIGENKCQRNPGNGQGDRDTHGRNGISGSAERSFQYYFKSHEEL